MLRVAAFDLETTDLCANRGILLAAVIHEQGTDPEIYRGDKYNKQWATKRSDDSALVTAVAKRLAECDVLIAHNGVRFDMPFLQTRLIANGLPVFPQRKLVDTWLIARNKLRLASYSLKSLTDLLHLDEKKTELYMSVWIKAMLDGDVEALDYIVEHCVRDVECLWKVFDALKDYSSVVNNKGSYW